MPTLTELRNEWSEAVAKAQALAEAKDQSGFDAAWADAESKRKAFEAMQKVDAANAALDAHRPTIADLRNPDDATDVPNVNRHAANRVPENFVDLGRGRIVPYATKHSEGYARHYPASVQLPTVMARYGPDLLKEAALEREAFNTYFRYGERAEAFENPQLRAALRRLSAHNALQEGTDSEGGYLVPTDERTSEIVHDPGAPGGVTRPISRQLTTSRQSGTIPSGTTITWGAIAEEATPSDSDPVFAQIAFTTRKSGFNSTVSDELLADSAFDVPGFLSMVGLEERGRYEDEQSVGGDGSTEPLGLRTAGAAQGTVADITDLLTLAAPTKEEIINAYFELPAQFRNNGTRWHMSSSALARIAAIEAAGGDLSLVPRMDGAPGFMLLGHPVVLYDGTGWDNAAALAANEEVGAIGDFARYYVFMDRIGVTFQRNDSVAFRSDQVAFKMRVRYDSFFTENNAFRILKAAAA